MLGDRLFLPRLGCAVTTVNPSCRFTKSTKGICPGFQDAWHPDLHSSSVQAFCHSEVPDKRLIRACSLPVQCIFSTCAGSGMCLTWEACVAHLYMVSQPPPHAACWTSLNTYVHTHTPSPIHDAQPHQTMRTTYTNSLWHVAKTWPQSPCPQAGQYILPTHPMPLLFL